MGELDPFLREQIEAGADPEQLFDIGYREAASPETSASDIHDEIGRLLGPNDEVDKLQETHNLIEVEKMLGRIGTTGVKEETVAQPIDQPAPTSVRTARPKSSRKPIDRRRLTARQRLTADKIPYRPQD